MIYLFIYVLPWNQTPCYGKAQDTLVAVFPDIRGKLFVDLWVCARCSIAVK